MVDRFTNPIKLITTVVDSPEITSNKFRRLLLLCGIVDNPEIFFDTNGHPLEKQDIFENLKKSSIGKQKLRKMYTYFKKSKKSKFTIKKLKGGIYDSRRRAPTREEYQHDTNSLYKKWMKRQEREQKDAASADAAKQAETNSAAANYNPIFSINLIQKIVRNNIKDFKKEPFNNYSSGEEAMDNYIQNLIRKSKQLSINDNEFKAIKKRILKNLLESYDIELGNLTKKKKVLADRNQENKIKVDITNNDSTSVCIKYLESLEKRKHFVDQNLFHISLNNLFIKATKKSLYTKRMSRQNREQKDADAVESSKEVPDTSLRGMFTQKLQTLTAAFKPFKDGGMTYLKNNPDYLKYGGGVVVGILCIIMIMKTLKNRKEKSIRVLDLIQNDILSNYKVNDKTVQLHSSKQFKCINPKDSIKYAWTVRQIENYQSEEKKLSLSEMRIDLLQKQHSIVIGSSLNALHLIREDGAVRNSIDEIKCALFDYGDDVDEFIQNNINRLGIHHRRS